ncbi:AraC family transcriptional regulator [Paenibacillus filicis]|uniref:AraC family transcriptional regulator n=1 Tax=Paenibacillus gyeongsangnamensis TaxID=3388067 RepID=A0ABT4QG03_9BACL|nr:AraC family transcriptional regulator [Paenibacillus filicis]MCZ8515798.1 AraC family transcriptional regulator [Paenibacillus filicis]
MTRYKNEQFFEIDGFPFFIDVFPVPHAVPTHSHEFVELVYVRSGRGLHTYRGEQYVIQEGDVFIIEPEAQHAYELEPGFCFDVYNVLFHPSFLAEELKALGQVESFIDFFYLEPFTRNSTLFQTRLSLTTAQQSEAKFLLQQMLAEFSGKQIGYRLLVKTKLIETLVFLSRCYAAKQTNSLGTQPDDKALIGRVCDFIAAHCEKPLTLEQVSRMCGLGSTSFSLKFKQQTGCTFLEYRNEMRIRLAKRLLAQTADKIIAIAHETGFEDISHFNRTFKLLTGMTPRAYRLKSK